MKLGGSGCAVGSSGCVRAAFVRTVGHGSTHVRVSMLRNMDKGAEMDGEGEKCGE